jgi:hypothetical protein
VQVEAEKIAIKGYWTLAEGIVFNEVFEPFCNVKFNLALSTQDSELLL